MALKATLNLEIFTELTKALDLGGASIPQALKRTYGYSDGAGVNQVNRVYNDNNNIAAAGTFDYDLSGALLDVYGDAVVFARIKGIVLAAAPGNTNTVDLGGAAANAFINWVGDPTDKVKVRPGGVLFLAANDATGYAVTAATADILRVTNGGGTAVDYSIYLIGSAT